MKEIIKEHKEWRNLIIPLAKSDIKKEYKNSFLGGAWTIVRPFILIMTFWFSLVFGLRSNNDINGYSFFLWLVAGLIPWFYMSEMIRQGSNAIGKYKYLITKMKFPISVISTFFSFSKLFINIVLILIMVVIFCVNGVYPDIYYIQIPIYIALMFIFFTIWSMMISPLTALYKDLLHLIHSFVTFLFWMSGIIWNLQNVDVPILRLYLKVNPITFIAQGFRDVFIYKKWIWEKPQELLIFLLIILLMLLATTAVHNKLKKEIPDVL